MKRIRSLLFLAFFLGCSTLGAAPAQSAVLYRSKNEWFRLELSGYLKNFLLVQTGMERFLPESLPPEMKKSLDAFLQLLKSGAPQFSWTDPQQSWKDLRQQMALSATDLTRLRLRLKMKFGESVSFHLHYELRPVADADTNQLLSTAFLVGGLYNGLGSFSGSGSGLGFGAFTTFDDRLLDFPRNLLNRYSFRLNHELDRLYLTWALPFADIAIGRQAFSFGVGRVFRPTDVLAPFSPQEVDTEERRGVDALKIAIPLGALAELLLVGAIQRLKPDKERSAGKDNYLDDLSPAGIARVRFTVWRFDFFVMGGYVQKDFVGGLGFSTSLWGAGIRGEAVYRYRYPTLQDDPDPDFKDEFNPNGVFSASLGIDYNIAAAKLILALEYYHNGAGATSPDKYLDLAAGYRFRRGEVFNLGSDYLAFLLNWEIHPLLRFNGLVMFNIRDLSFLLAPTLEYSIKQDVSVMAGAYIGLGEPPQPSFKTVTKDGQEQEELDLKLQSEFGSLGVLFLLGIRIYF